MKNLLLTVCISILIDTALADNSGKIYFKALGGVNKLGEINIKNQNLKRLTTIKSKTNNYSEFGIGYSITDDTRIDFTSSHYFNKYNTLVLVNSQELHYEYYTVYGNPFSYPIFSSIKQDLKIRAKFDINTLMLNGYIDFFNSGIVKFFIGAGFGVAYIRAVYNMEIITSGSYYSNNNKKIIYLGENKFTNVAYSLTLGTSIQVHSNIILELLYSYRGFGELSNNKDRYNSYDKKIITYDSHLNSHGLAVGARIHL